MESFKINSLRILVNVNSSNPMYRFRDFKVKMVPFTILNDFNPLAKAFKSYAKKMVPIMIKSALKNKLFIDDIKRLFTRKSNRNREREEEGEEGTFISDTDVLMRYNG